MTETIIDAGAGIVKCAHRKAAIIGAGPGRKNAPWTDPTWCVWALNEIYQPRFDRHFELHPMSVQNDRELAWLAGCPTPCYVLDLTEWDDGAIPHPVQFPLDRIRAAGFRDYFTCTFALELALAIHDGFSEIGLWGVELFLGTARERTVERACVEYWIGVAEGRGVKVVADSALAAHRSRLLYGYDYDREKDAVEGMMEELGRVIDAVRRSSPWRVG